MKANEFNKFLRLIGRSEKAFEEIYSFYYKRIVFHLKPKYGLAVAEDSAQLFFQSLLNENTTKSYIQYPTSWIFTCCENFAKRLIQKDSNIVICEKEMSTLDILKVEVYVDLYNELLKLATIDQEIIFKHVWEGYSFEEVAMQLEVKSSFVRQRYHRVTKKLNKFL